MKEITTVKGPKIRPIRRDTALQINTESLTQQHFRDEVDINRIVQKFTQTGEFPIAKSQAEYGTAPAITFTEAMQTVAAATEEFANLPSKARARFDNDPALYLDAAADPASRSVFEELGLLEPLAPTTSDDAIAAPDRVPGDVITAPETPPAARAATTTPVVE